MTPAGEDPEQRLRQRDSRGTVELEPLGEGERPPALLIAVGACVLLAVGVIVGAATIHDLSRHGGSVPGAVLLAGVLGLLAQGMYRRRYWAVLGFEALLAFQVIATVKLLGSPNLGETDPEIEHRAFKTPFTYRVGVQSLT